MTKPKNLKSKIFLDSGDPEETKKVLSSIGFLDGQTTNPSLVAKHPEIQSRIKEGKKFGEAELYDFYKEVVKEISNLIPNGSVSIEVYADQFSGVSDLLVQAEQMMTWIPNAHIKFPTTKAGLEAASEVLAKGGKVNMTLCFSQEQAAAVHAISKDYKPGDVFYSSFVGRLFDNEVNGIAQLENVVKMYKQNSSSAQVLAASFRNIEQFYASLKMESDIITVPFNLLNQWKEQDLMIPDKDWKFESELKKPEYEDLDLSKKWSEFNIQHDLTDAGLIRFAEDWNKLLK
jgi:transaldolase